MKLHKASYMTKAYQLGQVVQCFPAVQAVLCFLKILYLQWILVVQANLSDQLFRGDPETRVAQDCQEPHYHHSNLDRLGHPEPQTAQDYQFVLQHRQIQRVQLLQRLQQILVDRNFL